MPNISALLTFEYKSEYSFKVKKLYSEPKIYTAKDDLKKRWYVYYSYRDPESGLLKKMPPIYGNVNFFKTKAERLNVLVSFQRNLLKLLKEGYNPFVDNTNLYERKTTDPITTVNVPPPAPVEAPKMPLVEAFSFAMKLKKSTLNDTSYRGLNNRIDNFLKWMKAHSPAIKHIEDLNKKTVTSFLNYQLEKTSPRNRNNYRTDLSSVFQMLEDNEIILVNYVKKIPTIKAVPTRNKTYSSNQQEEIFKHLETADPILLLYIKFISYNFLRPLEVCRVKVKDINILDRKLEYKAKNSPLKTKIIPEILMREIPNLSDLNPEHYLFTPKKIGDAWDTQENNRRDYFSKRFKAVVKDHFKLGKDYGLYSFRHTFITRLYRELVKGSSPFAAKSKLMLITGHGTMDALQKYLRDIDAELPEDYSHLLK